MYGALIGGQEGGRVLMAAMGFGAPRTNGAGPKNQASELSLNGKTKK